MQEIEVRKNEKVTNEDAMIVLSIICGVLINVILFQVGWWICDNIAQVITIYIFESFFMGWFIFRISQWIIRFINRRN